MLFRRSLLEGFFCMRYKLVFVIVGSEPSFAVSRGGETEQSWFECLPSHMKSWLANLLLGKMGSGFIR